MWDWLGFCSWLHWSGLAPLAFEKLQEYALLLPADVADWLRTQYHWTVARNLYLCKELRMIVSQFSGAGIAYLVFKGPALAHLSYGLGSRVFYDLDILVRREDLDAATNVLSAFGYRLRRDDHHPFHRQYLKSDVGIPRVVELHFGVGDLFRPYSSRIDGIWDRSVVMEMGGYAMSVPSITDHLLLVMMQLPHHHWSPRLLADISRVVYRWKNSVDWPGFVLRTREWEMAALVGSTLSAIWSVLGVLPVKDLTDLSRPKGYFRRAQWNIVERAVVEQLSSRYSEVSRLASYVVVDRLVDVPCRFAQRVLRPPPGCAGPAVHIGARRIISMATALPEIGLILVKSVLKRRPHIVSDVLAG
jgi:hypothetical protein